MTFERFTDYARMIVGVGVFAHLVTVAIVGILFSRMDLVSEPFPIALPIAAAAAAWGWWEVFRTKPIVYTNCPCCHSRVNKDSIDTSYKDC